MKIDRFFSRFFLVAAVCVFCACSSDDDEDDGSGSGGSGKGSVTLNIGGVKATLDNVYWIAEPSGDGTNYYELQFMSFDMYKYVPGRRPLFVPVKLFCGLHLVRGSGFAFRVARRHFHGG